MSLEEGRESVLMFIGTLRRTFDGSGRSRRMEVLIWWLMTIAAGAVLGIAADLLSWEGDRLVRYAVQILFLIPMFALFVRRLHDQGRPGWWALLLPLVFALALPDLVRRLSDPQALLIDPLAGFEPLRWIGLLGMLAIFVLLLLPGTVGPNRYGPDPRLDGGELAGA